MRYVYCNVVIRDRWMDEKQKQKLNRTRNVWRKKNKIKKHLMLSDAIFILTFQSLRTIRKHHRKGYRRQPWWLEYFVFMFFFFDFCAYDFSLTILLLVDFVVVQLFSCFNKLKNGKTLSVLLSAANRMQSNGAAWLYPGWICTLHRCSLSISFAQSHKFLPQRNNVTTATDFHSLMLQFSSKCCDW